jgi:hypothetical protein
VLAAAAVALVLVTFRFARRQNRGMALGGRISSAKMAWLFFTIYAWFVVAPALAADSHVATPLRITLGAFAAWMWIRGAVEMYLLYVTKSWRPPIGITHDLSCLALIGGLGAWHGSVLGALAAPLDRAVLAFVGLVVASLIVEILYAALFFRAARGHTTGDDGVWFADDAAPAFRRLSRLTAVLNVPLYAALAAILAVAFGLWG